MIINIFCFSDSGAKIASELCDIFQTGSESVHSIEKYSSKYGFCSHKSISEDIGPLFHQSDALIFIGACGIAVRTVAPYIRSKTSDPAVIVMDDQKKFVIPILSGHIGGANALAERIAEITGAIPVITTATDRAGRFSCDSWASTHSCAISSLKTAKDVSAAILENDIPVSSEYVLPSALPCGLVAKDSGDMGIYIGSDIQNPYLHTLRLIPRVLIVGLGCRRGASKEDILNAVKSVFDKNNYDIRAVACVASIDVKKNEEGLLDFAKSLNVPSVFFTADELNSAEGDFEESEFVKKTVGTGNVCERSAVCAGGKIIIRKTVVNSVTVSVARKEWEVSF